MRVEMRTITRRDWLKTAAAAPAVVDGASPRRPNVVLIMSDDQGYGDLSCHGNPYLRTPVLDGLARQSVEFTRFYVSPVCAPTRSSLLTGRYNLRCGVYGVTTGYETMRSEEVTVAEALRAAGYRTGLVGKWHLGEHYPYVPHGQGFDEFIGFRTGHWPNYFDPALERNGTPIRTRGYITDVFTDEAIRFVERNRKEPFFLYLAYNAPHSPYQVPQTFLERFRDPALSRETAIVYGMIENLDRNVGRLLAKLDERQLAEDTIVIFLTDNGPNGQRFNAGLRGTKGSVYEGGVRAPFLIRWPGKLRPGRRDNLSAHVDVYPTLLDLCGVRRPDGPPIDGMSLRPVLEERTGERPERMLFTHRETARDPAATYPGAVRTQRFNLVNGTELYEIPSDPGERRNVAARYSEKVAELRAAYERWYEQAARECGFARKPIPVGYAAENPVVLPAPQSYFDGSLRFHGRNGYAHDWISGWTRVSDSVWWELDVVEAGAYDINLRYACRASDVGSRIAVEAGGARLEAAIEEATGTDPVPDHNLIPGSHYIELPWRTLAVGRAALSRGRTRLRVRAISKPGAAVMELKSVSLFRRS
jgi:arylsulfatase A